MHSILKRQLNKIFGRNFKKVTGNTQMSQFLKVVSDTYNHADEDRELLQHSLDVASDEMQKRNTQLQNKINNLNKSKGHVKDLEDMRNAMLNIMEDLKEEKKNVNIQLSEIEKFKSAVENSRSAIVIVKKNREIIYVNKWLEMLTGYNASELIGDMPEKILSEKIPEKVRKKMYESVKNGMIFESEEIFYKKKNGDVYQAALSVYPVLNEEKELRFFVGVHTDITKRKKAELARTEFVSIAGHQLRTPLSAMRWYLEELLDNPGSMSIEQSEHLAGLYKTSLRMIDLVNSMLDTARLEVGTMMQEHEEVDVISIVSDTVQEQSINAQMQDVDLEVNIEKENIKTITSDKKLIRMIVENLLSNAIKYTQPGGKASVSLVGVTNGTFAGKRFEGNGIGLTVADNGMGIPESQVHRMFEKMFRADNARSIDAVGTGLGLYTIKLIIDEMNGKIWFDTKEGIGTTFYVYIPYK